MLNWRIFPQNFSTIEFSRIRSHPACETKGVRLKSVISRYNSVSTKSCYNWIAYVQQAFVLTQQSSRELVSYQSCETICVGNNMSRQYVTIVLTMNLVRIKNIMDTLTFIIRIYLAKKYSTMQTTKL